MAKGFDLTDAAKDFDPKHAAKGLDLKHLSLDAGNLDPVQKENVVEGAGERASRAKPVVKEIARAGGKTGGNAAVGKGIECIALSQWSIVMVPNNPETTKVDASCKDWIVLVGRRQDISEMWHSSLIASRLSDREITTGSGRVYRLEGPLDEPSLLDHGFSTDIAYAFRDGFPQDWKERLFAEFARTQKSPPSSPRNSEIHPKQSKRRTATASSNPNPNTTPNPNIDPVPNPNSNPRNPDSPNPNTRTRRPLETPPSAAARYRRRSDPPPARHRVLVDCSPDVAGQTRSGRRVVRPLAYWENKYMHPGQASPSSAVLKRKWGNRLEM